MSGLTCLFPMLELRLDDVEGAAQIFINHKNSSIVIVFSQIVGYAKDGDQFFIKSKIITVFDNLV